MLYDVIIIGSGPAGISAALYARRANLNVLIISKGIGILSKIEKIENYYGLENSISGKELQKIGEKQAENLGVQIKKEEVVNIIYDEDYKIETVNNIYESKTIILATGMSRRTVNIKGIKEFEGKGVSYCATCDGFFFKDKKVAVLGSKDYAFHEAKYLKQVANSVTILTNGEELVENRSEGFEIDERKISEFRGTDIIEEIEFEDNSKEKIDGVFVALGTATTSDLARKLGVVLDEQKHIKVDEQMRTNLPGVYACGDCTDERPLQIAKAVYEGMIAGMSAIKSVKG